MKIPDILSDPVVDIFLTTFGIVSILLGLYRKSPTDIIWGIIAIVVASPLTNLLSREVDADE